MKVRHREIMELDNQAEGLTELPAYTRRELGIHFAFQTS